MCGRYALGVRMSFVRRRLQQQDMTVDEAPDDDDVRETYNFAPGNIGAIYRADVPGHEAGVQQEYTNEATEKDQTQGDKAAAIRYKLQGMKWGLVPFWTKRQPDYGSLMRTINCRDDSLMDDRGMWTSMKRRKRCIVICQGYYEWLKRGQGGKERIPYFTRRKDGDLMYLAGLWDSVSYEGSEEMLYTYTVITTSAHPSVQFLHDRMPVILDPNSEAMKVWLDPHRTTWSKELQDILKPYEGELECYQVPKEVGKVGNNSPDFIVPVRSKENRSNIANFFANAKKKTELEVEAGTVQTTSEKQAASQEDAPKSVSGVKREHPEGAEAGEDEDPKKQKTQEPHIVSPKELSTKTSPPKPHRSNQSKTRSATHNQKPLKKAEGKKLTAGTQRITNFFSK